MTTAPPVCPSCGVAWTDHLGMVGTCAKLREAIETLRVVRTWLDVGGHDHRIAARAVDRLDATLERIK
jgi:hypothetical protein